jgi:hypothetical protein
MTRLGIQKDAEQFLEGKIMRAKKYLILAVVALVLFGTFYRAVTVRATGESGGLEADKRTKRTTLRGLRGVKVLVVGLTTEIERYGLTARQIRTDVESRLRRVGIKTLSSEDPLTAPESALLRVWASIDKHPSAGLFLVNVGAELDQLVLLQRDLSASCTATTWKTTAKAGLMARKNLQDVRREVKDHVDRFISDYFAVNQSNQQKHKERQRKAKLTWSGQDSRGDLLGISVR